MPLGSEVWTPASGQAGSQVHVPAPQRPLAASCLREDELATGFPKLRLRAATPPRGSLAFDTATAWGSLDTGGGSKHSSGARSAEGCTFVSPASPHQ